MRTRTILFAGFLLGLSLSFMQCGPGKLCSAANCTGCCDASDQCVQGNSNAACGLEAKACVTCAADQRCIANTCQTPRQDGGSYTCSSTRTYTVSFTAKDVNSVRYREFSDGTVWNRVRFNLDDAVDGGLYVYQQIYFTPGTSTPHTVPLTTPTWVASYETGSAMALTECNSEGLCDKRYLSKAGSATYTALGSGRTGRMAGSASNITLVAWDFQTMTSGSDTTVVADQPLANADCIELTGMAYDLTYEVLDDGGVVYDAGQ